MAVADYRKFEGALGPVTHARIVDLSGGAFEDDRGFVWSAMVDGDYGYRPAGADADLRQNLMAGEYPHCAGVAILCTRVSSGAGLSILAANL